MTEEASMSVAERIAALKKAPPNVQQPQPPQRGQPGKLKLSHMVIPVGPPPPSTSTSSRTRTSLVSGLAARLGLDETLSRGSGGSSSSSAHTTTTTGSNNPNFDRPIVLPGRRRPATPQSISNIQFSTELST
eukprot:CAMPEP_0198302860 /NCGR_PEP_ID=MMETSP1449-20131203/56586_1 /TAXON_ID=420275 /ORGANISM="Attheya septentrionalis, Strain CCMP2084" /LENGTH=131 /DNA_ID=CAMNT_0044005331 /DNA_START=143 /DNA_END=538 /DNA_ORIENTATION=+